MRNKLVILNALIITCREDNLVIPDAALVVEGGDILWVGPEKTLPSALKKGAREIDAAGRILMPGLINMHAHCGDSLFRGLVEDLPLEAWLQTVWKAEGVILPSAENCRLGAELGFAELLLGGTTTVMDMFWHADQTFAAANDAGIRLASGGIYFDPPGMDGFGAEVREREAEALFQSYGKSDTHFVGTLPHGAYTVGPEALKIAFTQSQKHGGFFSTHAAETRVEQETVKANTGTSVIRHLHNLGVLSPQTVLAHCVHVDNEEMDLIAKTGTHVAHNPLSNLKLGSGIAPVPDMQKRGINLTLGTDGPISGNDMDMWLAIRLAATIHKGAREDATVVSTTEALHMATLNGAKALGAEASLGSIEVGKRADFIVLDTSAPHASPMFDPITHLVYSAGRGDVRDVFVGGRQLVKNRQLLTLDVATITEKCRALQPRITATLKAAP